MRPICSFLANGLDAMAGEEHSHFLMMDLTLVDIQ